MSATVGVVGAPAGSQGRALRAAICAAAVVAAAMSAVAAPGSGPWSPIRVAEAQVAACDRSVIRAPFTGDVVGGVVTIFGSAEIQPFNFYKVEWATQANPEVWIAVSTIVDSPVRNGVLDRWNTGALPDDVYRLKLTVVDDRHQEACRFTAERVTVRNATATPTSAVATERSDTPAAPPAAGPSAFETPLPTAPRPSPGPAVGEADAAPTGAAGVEAPAGSAAIPTAVSPTPSAATDGDGEGMESGPDGEADGERMESGDAEREVASGTSEPPGTSGQAGPPESDPVSSAGGSAEDGASPEDPTAPSVAIADAEIEGTGPEETGGEGSRAEGAATVVSRVGEAADGADESGQVADGQAAQAGGADAAGPAAELAETFGLGGALRAFALGFLLVLAVAAIAWRIGARRSSGA